MIHEIAGIVGMDIDSIPYGGRVYTIYGMERFSKILTASQYGQLKQSVTQLAKEAANRNFNKADVSVYAY